MPNWTGIITNAGTLLLSEWVNEKTLTITSAQAGTGTVPAVALMGQTALVNPKQTAAIAGGGDIEGGKRISLQVTAAETEYTLNQFGLYAKVDDGSPVLLAIYQNEKGIPIPSLSDTPNFLYTFQAAILVSNQGTWEVTISASASLTWELVGVPSGIAGLDATGKVPKEQLPAYSAADVGADPTGTAAQAVSTHNTSPNAHTSLFAAKQNKLTGAQGQVVGFDSQGNAQAQDPPGGGSGKRVCRFVVGTSTAGWTADDCDYLCDGTADDVEINAAIQALPSTGGEVVILGGTYNITATIAMNKDNVTLSGNGAATVLKRMWNGSGTGVVTVTADYCTVKNLQIDGNKPSYSSNFGIYLSGSSGNTITGNTCNNNGSAGIFLTGSSNNNTITGNTCNNNNIGISLTGSSNNNTITGNTCNNNNIGISLTGNDNNTITGNTCNNNDNAGISLSSSDNHTITGNTCNNNRIGINLTGNSSYDTITGNTCNNNDTGIYMLNGNNDTITGNTCIRGNGHPSSYTSSQYTIQIASGSQNNLIVGNNIMGKNYVDGGTNSTFANNKYQ